MMIAFFCLSFPRDLSKLSSKPNKLFALPLPLIIAALNHSQSTKILNFWLSKSAQNLNFAFWPLILSNLNRERPKNLRCFTKRSINIKHAGFQLTSNRLSTTRSGVLFSRSAPFYLKNRAGEISMLYKIFFVPCLLLLINIFGY